MIAGPAQQQRRVGVRQHQVQRYRAAPRGVGGPLPAQPGASITLEVQVQAPAPHRFGSGQHGENEGAAGHLPETEVVPGGELPCVGNTSAGDYQRHS